MTDIAIRVQNLSKEYHLGRAQERHDTLRDALSASFKRLRRRPSPRADEADILWALKDVSFEVQRGEVVGIIGRNGAGKSTLLKILSQITEPTRGRAEIHGRVGSLLEVGTGFHPELTGRENIYLNGAILGMRRYEIQRRFDEIVAFAEIERFLDTPVKRYSSGMYVRLAFAVAAHLEPEILLVDEVLAVGDADFQKKCLGKMEDVARAGRTVFFVSHNMGAISALCAKALQLSQGKLTRQGTTAEVINAYLSSLQAASLEPLHDRTDRTGNGEAKIVSVQLCHKDGKPFDEVISGIPCMVQIRYESARPLNAPIFKLTIYNSVGQPLVQFDSSLSKTPLQGLARDGQVGCLLDRLPLSAGRYRLNVSLEERGQLMDHVTGAYSFVVLEGNFHGTGRNIVGLREVCLADHDWITLRPTWSPSLKDNEE